VTAPITTHDVAVGDSTFHLSETGPRDAEPIVWLHGSGPGATALSNWEWMIGELGDTYHCIAPDIIGFGDSTHPNPPPEGMAAFTDLRVATLVGLLDTLGLDKVNLVGNSMGGIISLAIVRAAPERVSKLVLMGSGGAPMTNGPTPGLLKLITFYDNPTAENMAELLTHFVHDPAFFGDRLLDIAQTRLPRALRPEVERSHRATFNFAAGAPRQTTEDDFAQITHTTLVVHGDDDKIVPLESGEWIAKHLPNARLEVFADTGHWLQIEQGPKFAALLREFLRGP
jgi:2-hydroxymuconate-semialdehyde hydrolase